MRAAILEERLVIAFVELLVIPVAACVVNVVNVPAIIFCNDSSSLAIANASVKLVGFRRQTSFLISGSSPRMNCSRST